MKKIVLLLLFAITLTGCEETPDTLVYSSYEEIESINESYYAVYYYNSNDINNDNYYQDNQELYESYYLFNTYVLDASLVEDTSNFGEYDGLPVVHVIKNGVVVSTYKGSEISDFELKYFSLDYDDFANSKATTYDDVLNQSDDMYIEYYYSVTCSHCRTVKPDVLEFFYNNPDLEFTLYDLSVIDGDVPIEEFIGTPTMYVIENNQIKEAYIGSTEILEYLDSYTN